MSSYTFHFISWDETISSWWKVINWWTNSNCNNVCPHHFLMWGWGEQEMKERCNNSDNSHFSPFNFDTPVFSGIIQSRLHCGWDGFTIREDLMQIMRSQHVTEGCLSQKTRWMMSIFNICNWYSCIRYSVIDNCVNWYCHWIFSQDLLWGHIKRQRPQIYFRVVLNTGQDEEDSCSHSWWCQNAVMCHGQGSSSRIS